MLAFFAENSALGVALAFALGLLVGSFLNVVILRLPVRLEWAWRQEAREILGQPPEPPPPNIPAIDPDRRGAVTIREQLAMHTNDTSCATCHAAIDPPGFALENFDVIGGWRDRYRCCGQNRRRPCAIFS